MVLGYEVAIPSFQDTDKYSVKPALDLNNFAALRKTATEYAVAVYASSAYRQQDDHIDSQLPYGVKGIDKILNSGTETWWLSSQVEGKDTQSYYIDKAGMLSQKNQNYLFGLVVCKD